MGKFSTFLPIKWLSIELMDFARAVLIEIQVKLLGLGCTITKCGIVQSQKVSNNIHPPLIRVIMIMYPKRGPISSLVIDMAMVYRSGM